MVLLVKDGKFNAKFFYPDQIDATEDEDDRRHRLVQEALGDKPIVYPEWPEDEID